MPLFRALAKNMAPMTNADESQTNRLTGLTLFPIYLSLFIVSTLCLRCSCDYVCKWRVQMACAHAICIRNHKNSNREAKMAEIEAWIVGMIQTPARKSRRTIAMLSCLVITPRKKHACFIPTRRPSTSAILASPKDRDVYLKLAFQSYLSSLVTAHTQFK